MPFAKTDIVLDAVPTREAISRAPARVEITARDHGLAIGYASSQPAFIASAAAWAKQVETRGFVPVPITMAAIKAQSTLTWRTS